MSALERLRAYQTAQASGRAVMSEEGLPREVRLGDAVSCYVWNAGELRELVEPDGSRFNYVYGEDGRLLSVDRNGHRWADYRYDVAGRLAEVSRPEGIAVHSYDDQDRLVRTLRGDASPFLYQWDDQRVVSARTDREETRFAHGAKGRVTGLQQRVDGNVLSVQFSFGETGRLAHVRFPEWHQTIEFAWDSRGRPAAVDWNGQHVARFGTDDATCLSWSESVDGVRNETWSDPNDGHPIRQVISIKGQALTSREIVRDAAFRVVLEGNRSYAYDAGGRLSEACEDSRVWRFRHDVMENPIIDDEAEQQVVCDSAGRVCLIRRHSTEHVFRYNQAGEMTDALVDGERVARCVYDHKGRLVLKSGPGGSERYLYGPDDGLLAVADGEGRPCLLFLRLPTGIVGIVDFRLRPQGEIVCLHHDTRGNLVFAGARDRAIEGPFGSDPFGVPIHLPERIPYLYRGRIWHSELALYRIGCRWYDPSLRRFLTPDTYTGAPDDPRLVNPFRNARDQRMARAQILCDWLRQPELRNRRTYCSNDPVNRFDPDGHWSFGGVLLSLLGVLWTLPNTAFGLAVEVSCLLGEVVRWLVWLFSGGNITWQTPGFDVASSGRLNAFALVFKGGWLGSFQNLLGVTFGNIIFVNGEYQNHQSWQALPDPVTPPAYGGSITIPKSQALYEHELRHVNQYGWWGPFFHLGLPLFGVYEWDVILNGYYNARLEKDARNHGGF